MSTPSPNFDAPHALYGIDGEISNFSHLTENYKSSLYLCPDTASDKGYASRHVLFIWYLFYCHVFRAENGVASVIEHFKENCVRHVPFDSSSPEFQLNSSLTPLQIIQSYKKYEAALDALPTPTVIVCKSSRRASAVLVTYLVRNPLLSLVAPGLV